MKQMPTWRYLLGMVRYRPWLYLLHAVMWGLFSLMGLLAGLIARAFFDTLTGEAHMPGGITGLIVLLAVIAAGRVATLLIAGFAEIMMRFTMSGLLRLNLLRNVLKRPGAYALPHSIGETISRFRDDAYQGEDAVDWSDELTGQGLLAVGALGVALGQFLIFLQGPVDSLLVLKGPGLFDDGERVVRGVVVDHDQLDIAVGGWRHRLQRRERLAQQACTVVRADNHRDPHYAAHGYRPCAPARRKYERGSRTMLAAVSPTRWPACAERVYGARDGLLCACVRSRARVQHELREPRLTR